MSWYCFFFFFFFFKGKNCSTAVDKKNPKKQKPYFETLVVLFPIDAIVLRVRSKGDNISRKLWSSRNSSEHGTIAKTKSECYLIQLFNRMEENLNFQNCNPRQKSETHYFIVLIVNSFSFYKYRTRTYENFTVGN